MSTQYPRGAGPNAGAYSGEVYAPPAAGLAPAAADGTPTDSTPRRPDVLTATAAPDTSGRMVAKFTAPTTAAWEVKRIVVSSTINGTALIYVGSMDAANIVTGTTSCAFDENDPNQPYLVPEGQALTVHFLSGGACTARIEFEAI